MKAIPFMTGWTCRHLDAPAPGVPVTLPHDAMLAEPRNASSAGGANTGWFEGRDYLYEKRFTPDAETAEQTLTLEFEGVYRKAEVFLNGEKLLFRPYGYTNFTVDLTGKLRPGQENLLAVIARNADQPNSRWYSGAGIYRPVTLWAAPQNHIPVYGLRVRTISIEPATVEITVQTVGSGPVQYEITKDGAPIATGQGQSNGRAIFRVKVPNAALWSTETPALYHCKVNFAGDSAETDFGIRTIHFGKTGFLLNGKRVLLRGACIHHDNGVLGACTYPQAEQRRVRLLQQTGYNAIRSAHNPCSKYLLDACDKLGMLVMDEYLDQWYIHKTEYDYANYFADWWQQDLRDMVDKDYNHPSVILYSTGNEVSETAQPRGIAYTRQMTEYLHKLDDSRAVTCGINIFFNFLSSIGFGVYSDEKAKKEAAKSEKAGQNPNKKKAVGSEFFNNLAGLLGADFMKTGATLPPCDWKTRDAFAALDVAGYNYGIFRYKHDLKKYPDRLIVGSETFCADAYRFFELAKTQPRLLGDFVWAGMDYIGETGIGAWEYTDYASDFSLGPGWVTAGAGRLDLTGKPHGEALYTRVAFELEQGPRIAVWPVNHTNDKHSPSAWKMSHAQPSWSWQGCGGGDAIVEVYARAASVELRINGKIVGRKSPKNNCLVQFKCTYEDGEVQAVSYDENGQKIGSDTLRTAKPETELRAEAEEHTAAPGSLCYIRLRYTDPDGQLKPLARGRLQVSVQGGKLLGLGNACPYNELGYCGSENDTYYGEALAVLQADATPGGTLCLSVTDGKLQATARVPITG